MIDAVKIGAMTYRVREVSDLHHLDDAGRKQWLFGQILHRADFEEHPETAIIALGYGLLEVLLDNPALVDLLQE